MELAREGQDRWLTIPPRVVQRQTLARHLIANPGSVALNEYTLTISSADMDFLFGVITQTPLPYVRVAPLITSLSEQVQKQNASAAQAVTQATPAQ